MFVITSECKRIKMWVSYLQINILKKVKKQKRGNKYHFGEGITAKHGPAYIRIYLN